MGTGFAPIDASEPFPGRDELLEQARQGVLVQTAIADGTFGVHSDHGPFAKTLQSVPVAGQYESNGVYVLFLLHTGNGHLAEIEIVTVPDGQAIINLNLEDIHLEIETEERIAEREAEREAVMLAWRNRSRFEKFLDFLGNVVARIIGLITGEHVIVSFRRPSTRKDDATP